jgi:uncharacterized damage-inducible protein DinB
MSIAASMLPEFDHEMANTRKTLERIPDNKFDYKPHPKSMTFGALASHVALIPEWGAITVKEDDFDFAPVGKPAWSPPKITTNAELLKAFDKGVKELRAALESASDAAMMKQWSLKAGGKAIFTMPRVAALRSMIFNHAIHHRAQLGVYLRLNDLPVPGVYGPSADEGKM